MEQKISKTPIQIQRGSMVLRGDIYRGAESKPGATPIILSHGFMSNAMETGIYAPYLAEAGYVAVTYEFIGGSREGKSDGRPEDMTILTEKADLRAVMDYVKTIPDADYSKLILAGCSQGGFVSGLVAADYPEEVARLLLFYPALCIPDDARKGEMLGISFDPANVPEFLHSEWGITFQGALASDMMDVDAIDRISDYPGQVLVLYGVKDPIVNCHYMTDLVAALKKKRGTTGKADKSVQAFPVSRAEHGFKPNEVDMVVKRILAWLNDFEEILTVDVVLTQIDREETDTMKIGYLYFDGHCQSDWFTGDARPGSYDLQKRDKNGGVIELKADYVMDGVDCEGKECWVHVINRDIGHGWEPTVETNSEVLSFMNGQQGITLADGRDQGPIIHVLGKRD